MPNWGELQEELAGIQEQVAAQGIADVAPADLLRRKYLGLLSQQTERATILYYSGFQQNPGAAPIALSVTPADMNGFMLTCSGLEGPALDLFLHSPGGDPDAVEQICCYLRTRFDHIRAVVPLNAMSAATMMALSADEILMGAHSQLGPIDPQMTIGMPEGPRTYSAQAIKDQFALAIEDCKDPAKLNAWIPILRSFAPGLLAACDHASERARNIVADALREYMFKGEASAEEKAHAAAEWFGDAARFLSHGHPVRREAAREQGIVIKDLEDQPELQDAVLSVHHATIITLANWGLAKLVENNNGQLWSLAS